MYTHTHLSSQSSSSIVTVATLLSGWTSVCESLVVKETVKVSSFSKKVSPVIVIFSQISLSSEVNSKLPDKAT